MGKHTVKTESLCHITRDNFRGTGQDGEGCGVFISPRHILTAWHVIQGSTEITVTNTDGFFATIKRAKDGGQHFFNKGLDIAIMELSHAIAPDIVRLNRNGLDPEKSEHTGFLGTMFNQDPTAHHVHYKSTNQRENLIGQMASYDCEIRTGAGYSGSPIFADDGQTVISILKGGSSATQDLIERLDGFARRSGLEIDSRIPFKAPTLQAFSSWTNRVAPHIGLN